jgi:CHAT domain-containing protein/tetratricopeptide (TPR) repeat protein
MRETACRCSQSITWFSTNATSNRESSPINHFVALLSASLTASLLFLYGQSITVQASPPIVISRPQVATNESLQQDANDLPLLSPVERELKGGETHSYRVNLASGQFLYALVEQKGVDVEVALFAPDGHQLSVADSPNDLWGPEPVLLVAETPGDYRVEVRAPNSKAPAGRYEIKPFTVREATSADRVHVTAERLFDEGRKLRAGQTAAERRASIEKYEQALPLFGAAGDSYRQALTHLSIGFAYAQLSEYRSAVNYGNESLSLARALDEHRLEAAIETFLGAMHDALGDVKEGLEHFNRALDLSRESGNRSAEASTLNNIGTIYFNIADWQKALEYWSQALPIYKSLGNQQQESITLLNIGVAYNTLGESQEALRDLQESLTLRQTIGDKNGASVTLSNIGNAYFEMGDTQQALEYYNQALGMQHELGNRGREADTLDRIGVAYAAMGQPEKALEYHQQALPLQHATGNLRREAISLSNLGNTYNLLGQPNQALDYYNRALPMFRDIGDLNSVGIVLEGIARAERSLGNLSEARKQIEAALASVEQVRARVSRGQLRASYLASRQDAYHFYIDLLMQLHRLKPAVGFDVAALEASEGARARSLLELLTEAHVDIRQGADAALLSKERELSQQLNAKVQRLTVKNTPAQLAALNREIGQLELEYQQVQEALRKSSPRYAALVQPQPLKLKEIQQQVLDPDTLLLEYSLGDERSYVWAITNNAIKSYELPKREEVEKAARKVYELLTARSQMQKGETAEEERARVARAAVELPRAAGELSRIVLGPAATDIGNKRLLIVADGALQYVPFAMLPAPGENRLPQGSKRQQSGLARINPPLIVEHEVISLPSASTLAVQRKQLLNRELAPNAVAVLADPVFRAGDERVKTGKDQSPATGEPSFAKVASTRLLQHISDNSAGTPEIRRLPFTRREADQILAVAPAPISMEAIGFKANLATATGPELSRYRYVHFATHGYFDSEHPNLSGLVLSLVDEQGRPRDGFLGANEIYNLQLPAELVVLSACETGLGKEVKGEGLVGLTRGFMYAGAARVMVSLWSVSDKATSELMQRFYKRLLQDRQRPAAAMRAAQVEMLRQPRWREPYFWAAFTLQGEWR